MSQVKGKSNVIKSLVSSNMDESLGFLFSLTGLSIRRLIFLGLTGRNYAIVMKADFFLLFCFNILLNYNLFLDSHLLIHNRCSNLQ